MKAEKTPRTTKSANRGIREPIFPRLVPVGQKTSFGFDTNFVSNHRDLLAYKPLKTLNKLNKSRISHTENVTYSTSKPSNKLGKIE